MSLFGIQESDQRNIVNNNIDNSVSNSSTNIQDNTFVSESDCQSNVDVTADTIVIPPTCPEGSGASFTATCDQTMRTAANIFNQTDTNFDTTLTNNISNELKNKAKIETPSLMGSGLFSSQANHQLNEAVNSQENNVRNDIYTKRKTMFRNKQSADDSVTVNIGSFTGCNLHADASGIQNNVMDAVIKTLDTVKASNSISNVMSNTLSNTVEMSGAGIWGVLGVALLGFMFLAGPAAKSQDQGDNKAIWVGFIFIVASTLLGSVSSNILGRDESYEIGPTCDDDNFTLDPSFEQDQDQIDVCYSAWIGPDSWKEKRADRANFPRWKVEGNTTVSTQREGEKQSTSVRGTVYDKEKKRPIDYTTLNIDPYSDIECRDDGLDAENKNRITDPSTGAVACRTIQEDYVWEQILQASCGCCGCDPNKIEYYNDWEGRTSCHLDNSRPLGVFCDKGIDIIQPGVGYKTSGPNADGVYRTTCIKRDGTRCKKKGSGETLEDIGDNDEANLSVRLVSHDSCVGKNEHTLKCYQAAANTGGLDWSGGNFFGDATNIRCNPSEDWSDELLAGAGFCPGESTANPEGCVKADKCVMDFMEDVNAKRNAAVAEGGHAEHSKAACDSAGWSEEDREDGAECEYRINGVKEILIEERPEQHIDSPDNIYTIVKDSVSQHQDMTTYLHKPGGQEPSDVIWNPPTTKESRPAPNPFRISTRLLSSNSPQSEISYHKFENPAALNYAADCSPIDAIRRAKFNDFIISKDIGTNLCDAKFRRLPACAKEDDGAPRTTFGCDGVAGDCDKCVANDESGEVDEPVYEKSLIWDFSVDALTSRRGWVPLIAAIVVYIVLLIVLFIYLMMSGSSAHGIAAGLEELPPTVT